MKIVWFSEVKWAYLTHRHHQIIKQFPDDWQVLFIENYVLGRENHFKPQRDGRVTYATVPTFKPTNRVFIDYLQSLRFFRWIVTFVTSCWVRYLLRSTGFHTKERVLITSNIFFGQVVDSLRASVKVYDCNDYPMGFSDSLSCTEEFFSMTIGMADVVITVTEKLKEDVQEYGPSRVQVIGNGVDVELFGKTSLEIPEDMQGLKGPIVLYAGVISDWFDFELMGLCAQTYPDVEFVIVGPVINPKVRGMVEESGKRPNVHFMGMKPHDVLPSYIRASRLCWIPFKKNSLIERFSPNKLFEYAAGGRSVVTLDYTKEIIDLSSMVYVATTAQDFVQMVGDGITAPPKESSLVEFAKANSWRSKSQEFAETITRLKENTHAVL